jgi:hypothetical protein
MHIDCGSVAFTVKVLVIGWRRGVTHGRPRLASLIGCGDVRSEPRLRGERGLPPSLCSGLSGLTEQLLGVLGRERQVV